MIRGRHVRHITLAYGLTPQPLSNKKGDPHRDRPPPPRARPRALQRGPVKRVPDRPGTGLMRPQERAAARGVWRADCAASGRIAEPVYGFLAE